MNYDKLTKEQIISILKDALNCIKEQQQRIDDAIEYIENNDLYYQDVDYDYEENMTLLSPSDEDARAILLSILKGEENDIKWNSKVYDI